MSSNEDFVGRLATLADNLHDRAPLAALRRGASGEAHDMARVYPYVLPFVPVDARERHTQAYLDVACLFGLHPTQTTTRGTSLANALRTIWQKTGSASIEQRFVALLQSHREELLNHIRYCVTLARSHEQALRWDDVLNALLWWDSPGSASDASSPQRRWARDFWERRDEETSQKDA